MTRILVASAARVQATGELPDAARLEALRRIYVAVSKVQPNKPSAVAGAHEAMAKAQTTAEQALAASTQVSNRLNLMFPQGVQRNHGES
jgi:hypothetical protein